CAKKTCRRILPHIPAICFPIIAFRSGWVRIGLAASKLANLPSFLCLSQESSRRVSTRREESFQPKDLG
ncbi:hypothetical protein SB816_34615, partial [Achromobacter sp. SIMBA_011]|uniref:hypothetical protein n=1 Tax=Achromobacter sp. SIMBA_011 TaxID=3085759 RepID=UPI003978AA4D